MTLAVPAGAGSLYVEQGPANTLEPRVAVSLTADLAEIRRTLSEREREEHLRIKRLVARRQASALSSK